MKNRLYFVLALAGLLLSACTAEEFPAEGGCIQAIMESEATRTAVTDEGVFTWSEGDQVWLQTTSGSVTGTLSSGAGTSSASFSFGSHFGELTGKSVYPYNSRHSISGDILNVFLPASYDLGSSLNNTNSVMYGVNVGGKLKFNHMAGVMRFRFKNVPAGVNSFVLTLDKRINGIFEADLGEPYPIVSTEEASYDSQKSVTLNFDALTETSDICLYIPLPVGTYETLGLSLKADDQSVWSYSNTVTNTISRKTLKLMPLVTIAGSIDGDIEGGGDDKPDFDESELDMDVLVDLLNMVKKGSTDLDTYVQSLNERVSLTQSLLDENIWKMEEKHIEIQEHDEILERVRQYKESLTQVLSERLADLSVYNEELNETENSLYSVSAWLSSVADDIEYYKNNTTGYEDVIGQFEIQVEELVAAIEYLYERIESSLQHTAYLANLIYQLSEDIWEEQAAVNEAVSISSDPETKTDNGIEDGINDLKAKINELTTIVASIDLYLSEIESSIGAFVEEFEYIVAEVQTIKAYEQETTAALEGALVELEELEQNAQALSLNLEEYAQEYSMYNEYYLELYEKIQRYDKEMRWLLEFLANGIQTEDDWITACDSYEWLRYELMALLDELNELLKNVNF
ncbi:MAG: hypothetical protein J6R30_03230 [Bacteroidales bacterium]|nr:hypothetical protein [Bacteroidales bacterium]